MSIKAMTWVWEHSEQKGARLLMMLAIADRCDDLGECYPGLIRLASKARITKQAASKNIKLLEKAGELSVTVHGGIKTTHGNTNRYYLKKYRDELGLETPDGNRSEYVTYDGVSKRIPQEVYELTPQGVSDCIPYPSGDTSVDTSEKDLPPENGGSGTGDDGDDEWLHATWDTKNNTEHIFCTDGCNGMIDETYYYDGKGRVLCPGCYVALNDTNPPTPPKPAHVICPECREKFVPNDDGVCKSCGLHWEKSETPHERYQALEARKNAPQLTESQKPKGKEACVPHFKGQPCDCGCEESLGEYHIELDNGKRILHECFESQQSKDCAGTEHINPAVLCEVDTDGMSHVDNCVVCQGDMFDVRTITYYTGYDNWPFPVCESCETWLQSLEREAPKPAPKKGRAKAKKAKKQAHPLYDDMCTAIKGAFGVKDDTLPKAHFGRIGKVANELLDCNARPFMISRFYSWCKKQFDSKALNYEILTKWYPQWRAEMGDNVPDELPEQDAPPTPESEDVPLIGEGMTEAEMVADCQRMTDEQAEKMSMTYLLEQPEDE